MKQTHKAFRCDTADKDKHTEDKKMVCPECGAEMEADANGCDACGYKKPKQRNMSKGDKAQQGVSRVDIALAKESWMTRPFERTTEGFLRGRAIVTSIGVFQYADAAGNVHGELRLPEEVFATDSLNSLKMKPVTNDHPIDMVEPSNVRDLAVGSLGSNPSETTQLSSGGGYYSRDDEVTDGQHLSIDMVITDPDAISDVLNGKRALSCGYSCDLENDSGVYLGMPYQFIQRNIRYNHVAIVDAARAGDAARIRMDSAGGAVHIDSTKPQTEEDAMKTVKLDGVEYQAEAPVLVALNKATERADSLQNELTQLKTAKSTLEAERDTAKARADELEEEIKVVKNGGSKIKEAVKQRRRIEKIATDAGLEVKEDAEDLDVQKQVVAKVFPKLDLKDKDEAYIRVSFDNAATVLASKADEDKTELTGDSPAGEGHTDSKETVYNADEARQRMMDNMLKKRKE